MPHHEHEAAANVGPSVDVQSRLSEDYADFKGGLADFYGHSEHRPGLTNYMSVENQAFYIPAFTLVFVVALVFFGVLGNVSGSSSGITMWTNLLSAAIIGGCEYVLYAGGNRTISREECSTILVIWTAFLALTVQGRVGSKLGGNRFANTILAVLTSFAVMLYGARTDGASPIGPAIIVAWPLFYTFFQF